MGPAAGVDLCSRLISQHSAARDQDHIPFILYSMPQIPGRSEAILYGSESPLNGMLEGINSLVRGGARAIAIACSTAHAWLPELRERSPVPILDIVDAVAARLESVAPIRIGLMATEAAHQANVFRSRLESRGYRFIEPPEPSAHQGLVNEGIKLTKSGNAMAGGEVLACAMEELLAAGAQSVILGCTEIPVALAAYGSPIVQHGVDPTAALADACIAWSMSFAEEK